VNRGVKLNLFSLFFKARRGRLGFLPASALSGDAWALDKQVETRVNAAHCGFVRCAVSVCLGMIAGRGSILMLADVSALVHSVLAELTITLYVRAMG